MEKTIVAPGFKTTTMVSAFPVPLVSLPHLSAPQPASRHGCRCKHRPQRSMSPSAATSLTTLKCRLWGKCGRCAFKPLRKTGNSSVKLMPSMPGAFVARRNWSKRLRIAMPPWHSLGCVSTALGDSMQPPPHIVWLCVYTDAFTFRSLCFLLWFC